MSKPSPRRPLYILASDIILVAVLSEHTVRRHLKKLGIAETIGGKVVVSRYRLRDRWPSIAEALEAAAEEGEQRRPEVTKRRPPPPRTHEARARAASAKSGSRKALDGDRRGRTRSDARAVSAAA